MESDISSDGVRLDALRYDKDGKYIGTSTGIGIGLNSTSEESNWMEVFCGVNKGEGTAYVRLQLIIAPGTMNVWIDDLKCMEFDGNEYIESFDSVCDDGKPDGWDTAVLAGNPTFEASDSKFSIRAESTSDKGVLVGRWDTGQEYSSFTFTTVYAATTGTKANLTIKYYDFAGRELEEHCIEKVMESTGGNWEEYSFRFIYPSAKYALIEIANEGSGSISIDGIQIVVNDEEVEDEAVAVEVLEYEVTEETEAGGGCVLTMTVLPTEDITSDVQLDGYLWKRNTTQRKCRVEFEQVEGPTMSEWKAGEKVTVQYRFEVPDFLSDSKYILQLNTAKIQVANDDVVDNKLTQPIRVFNSVDEVNVKSEMKELNGTQTIYINGKPYPNMSYTIPSYTEFISEKADGYMHDAGNCVTRIWSPKKMWIADDEYDFTELDSTIYTVLENHPDTYLMVTFDLTAPEWWETQNPDELIVIHDGTKNRVSYASDKFVEDATKANLAMLEYMMQQPYANRIVGAVLSSCRTGEWLWWADGQIAQDFSTPSLIKWREWLKETYQTDEALQTAWNRNDVTLETAVVPTYEERKGTTYTTLLDPTSQRDTIDYVTFMQDLVAQRLNDFANTITEALDDRIILGAYYGYLDNVYYWAASNTLHLGLESVLENENIDFLAAPVLYGERYDGESGSYMQMVESVLAHGKAIVVENDVRTSTYNQLSSEFLTREDVGPTYTVSDTLSQLGRNFANEITRGVGQWYYNMWGSWFEHKQFSDLIEVMHNEKVVNQARETEYNSEICYIIDEDMFTYLAYGNFYANYNMVQWLLKEQRYELARIGVPVDMYCMSDLEKGLVPDYKIYVMLAPVEIDASEKAAVNQYLKNGQKTIVWQYISGASDGKQISAQNMSEIIDMNVVLDSEARDLSASFASVDHALTQGIQGKYFGCTQGGEVVSPIGIINDGSATVLAYMNDNNQEAAVAVKEMENWTSIYSAVPCLPTEFFINLLEQCGVHRYSKNTNDVIFANDNYVGINAEYGGSKEISLDGTYAVYDVYACKMYSMSTNTIKFDMEDKSTKLFRLMPENKLAVYVEVASGGTSEQEGYHEVSLSENYSCEIKANEGYQISAIIIDGVKKEVQEDTYTVQFKDLKNSHFVKAEFMAVAEDIVEIEEPVIYTAYTKEQIQKYWSTTTKTAPVEEGYVFGGWFQESTEGANGAEKSADNKYYAPLTEGAMTKAIPDTAYAKFVPAHVLSIKAQNQAGVNAQSQKTHIRIISSVDSTNYQKVGFDIWRANKSQLLKQDGSALETTYLYTGLKEGINVKSARKIFGGESEYLFVWQMNNVGKSNFSKIIYARPYWVTKDGTTVRGLAKYVHIEDEYEGYISVPVNISRTSDVAAGTVDMSYAGYDSLGDNFIFEAGRMFPEMEFYHDTANKTIKMVGVAEEFGNYKNTDETIYANIRFKRPTTATTLNFDMKLGMFCDWEKMLLTNGTEVKAWDIEYEIKEQ